MVALHHLSPLQRTVLLLREVVGFSTAEIASQLDTTAPSVNSALQRARAGVRGRLPATSQQSVLRVLGDQRTRALVQRYADAMERGDADALISMLTRDASWSMPPVPTWFRGHEAIRQCLINHRLRIQWRILPASANGQLAVGCYLFDEPKAKYVSSVLDVLTLTGAKIADVTSFLSAEVFPHAASASPQQHRGSDEAQPPPAVGPWITGPELFSAFGLPIELP
jgi:RNA polymerase sigma-70 factor (ECF subfamily)